MKSIKTYFVLCLALYVAIIAASSSIARAELTINGVKVSPGLTMAGNIDFGNYLALNIGNAANDFDEAGGLNLAYTLTTTKVVDTGDADIRGRISNTGAANAGRVDVNDGLAVAGASIFSTSVESPYMTPTNLRVGTVLNLGSDSVITSPNQALIIGSAGNDVYIRSGSDDAIDLSPGARGTGLRVIIDANGEVSIANSTTGKPFFINEPLQGVVVTGPLTTTTNVTVGGDIAAAGGFKMRYDFEYPIMAPAQTAVKLIRSGATGVFTAVMPTAGSLLSICSSYQAPISAGTVYITATVNGAAQTNPVLAESSGMGSCATLAKDTKAFAANNDIGVIVSTNAAFAGPTEVVVDLTVER